MERFFIFDKFNTYYDWGFYLTEKSIGDPPLNTNYLTIDGKNGSLDLSEALTGEITYQNRTISATFVSDHGSYKEREALLRSIATTLHGRRIKIIEPDDPTHYFIGRVKIKSSVNNMAYAKLTIEATCDPWRYAMDEITNIVSVNNNDINIVINNNGVSSLCPELDINGNISIINDVMNVTLTDGSYKISDFKLKVGSNIITLSGDGVITFRYREVAL